MFVQLAADVVSDVMIEDSLYRNLRNASGDENSTFCDSGRDESAEIVRVRLHPHTNGV